MESVELLSSMRLDRRSRSFEASVLPDLPGLSDASGSPALLDLPDPPVLSDLSDSPDLSDDLPSAFLAFFFGFVVSCDCVAGWTPFEFDVFRYQTVPPMRMAMTTMATTMIIPTPPDLPCFAGGGNGPFGTVGGTAGDTVGDTTGGTTGPGCGVNTLAGAPSTMVPSALPSTMVPSAGRPPACVCNVRPQLVQNRAF